jgi:hypothetical protein
LPNNIILVVTIDKFDPNPMFVNINKLKPYRFIEDETLQLSLAKPSDWPMMNVFKPKNVNHYLLNLKIFNL